MPKSKLILIITSTYPFGDGEEFFEAEIRGLIAHGLNVIILPIRPRGPLRRDASDLNYMVLSRYRISIHVFLRTFLRLVHQGLRLTKRRRFHLVTRSFKESMSAAYGPQLSKTINKLQISHIHAYWSSGPAMLAMTASQLTKVNWSFTGHSGDLIDGVDLNRKAKTCDGIRVISERGKRILIQTLETSILPEVIHLGVEVPSKEVIRKSPSEFKIACVGNLIPIKNHHTLIKALRIIESAENNFSVDIIGSGPLESELRECVHALGLDETIVFRGQIAHTELLLEYAKSRYQLVVLASGTALSGQQEGIPVSLMEAMSYGIPVVSTESGGVPELVTKELNLLVPPNDPTALSSKILEIMNMSIGDRATLGLQCRTRIIEDFNVTLTSNQYATWLKTLLK